MRPKSPSSAQLLSWSTVPAAVGAAIFMIIAAATGGSRKTVLAGGAVVGAVTFAITFGISIAISKATAARRAARKP